MDAILDKFFADPGQFGPAIELLRVWSVLSLQTYLPLWIFDPNVRLNLKPSRANVNPKTKLCQPEYLAEAVRILMDHGLCVKMQSNNGIRLRLWDDAWRADYETLRQRLWPLTSPPIEELVLDLLLLFETIVPQTQFYDIFSVHKRETSNHCRRLCEWARARVSVTECNEDLRKHVMQSEEFAIYCASVVVLGSVDTAWNNLPQDTLKIMDDLLEHCLRIIKLADDDDLFDTRRLRIHTLAASSWKNRITNRPEDALADAELAVKLSHEFNDALPSQPFSVIDPLEVAHVELLWICMEKDPVQAKERTLKCIKMIEHAGTLNIIPDDYLKRTLLELSFEMAVLERPGDAGVNPDSDAAKPSVAEAIRRYKEFVDGYSALEGPEGYHVSLGLFELIGLKISSGKAEALFESVQDMKRCLRILEREVGPSGRRQSEIRFALGNPIRGVPEKELFQVFLDGLEKAQVFYGKNNAGVVSAYRDAVVAANNLGIADEIKQGLVQEFITVAAKVFGKDSKEYAEALLSHAEIVGMSHAAFLPDARTAAAVLEKLPVLDKDLLAAAYRLLIHFYRSRHDHEKAMETIERGLETLGNELNWARRWLQIERLDLLLVSGQAELAMNEAKAIIDGSESLNPNSIDIQKIKSGDAVIWLRYLRAIYRHQGTDAFAKALPEAMEFWKQHMLNFRFDAHIILDSAITALSDAFEIELIDLAMGLANDLLKHVETNFAGEKFLLDKITACLSSFEQSKRRLDDAAKMAQSTAAEESQEPASRPHKRTKGRHREQPAASSALPIIALVAVSVIAGVVAGFAVLQIARRRQGK